MLQDPEPDCFSLGCLYCDTPTTETYCSQACRLAEASGSYSTVSGPSSPQSSTGFYLPPQSSTLRTNNQLSQTSSSRSTNGFYLPPAYDFQTHRASSRQQTPTSTRSPKLSPSSSRSSFKNELSIQAQNDLMYYTNAFDRSREWKRRLTH